MKLISILFLGLLALGATVLLAQAPSATPQKVHSIVTVQYEYDWYVQQHRLWKATLSKTPNYPDGWSSYYTAARMAAILCEEAEERNAWHQEMNTIVEAMKTAIKGTYEYHFI